MFRVSAASYDFFANLLEHALDRLYVFEGRCFCDEFAVGPLALETLCKDEWYVAPINEITLIADDHDEHLLLLVL